MKDSIILLIMLVILALVCGCVSQQATTTTTTAPIEVKECVLSLCDCKCHIKGTTTEEKTGALCGINCLGEYGVSGCEFKDNVCREVYEETTTKPNVGIANPASQKCIEDGGDLKILNEPEGERGVCFFSDGSVCDEWAYFRGECTQGKCLRKCDAIGTRSEGWYDCNGKLLYWDNCSS